MKIVKESLIYEEENNENNIIISAGLAIIQNGTILLVHPKGSRWWGTYSIPKGEVNKNEDLLDTAIRETREEVGINISENDIVSKEPEYIDYKDKKGKIFKRVYYFIVEPKFDISKNDIHPDEEEVDWAGFITKEKAMQRIHWRLKSILDHVEDIEDEEDEEDEEN